MNKKTFNITVVPSTITPLKKDQFVQFIPSETVDDFLENEVFININNSETVPLITNGKNIIAGKILKMKYNGKEFVIES